MGKLIAVFALILLVLASCAPGANTLSGQVRPDSEQSEPAGFFTGLWQGFIAPFTFLVSLFNKSVGIYEPFNNGGWYNFGFLFGLSIIFGGSGGAGKHYHGRRKKRVERDDYDE